MHTPWIVNHLWIIPLLPFVAALITALVKQPAKSFASTVVILAMAGSLFFSLQAGWFMLHSHEPRFFSNFTWFEYGEKSVQLGFLLDPLSAMMLFVVTLVSFLVFIFSTGYMHEDENMTRFFCFLSLFAGSMLALVIANSLLLLFMAWELVGLSSFLLIGFWYHKPSAVAAMKKAFITTRIGDVGFLIGILWFYNKTGTTLFYDAGGMGSLQPAILGGLAAGTALSIALLIFCGAAGKSGQFPLHVWLPDAMEGPTPVSALIHAATMVAAGVFLVGRMYPVFEVNHTALDIVAIVGAFTALFAATIAVAQWDIKRILAFSTVSQLGYMMMGLGVGGYVAGLFHLFTHAFFKALLFLGSGSIIHGCHHEQDIRKMGGLKDRMPTTFVTYIIGMLALAGFFPFAGFFSKDELLLDASHAHLASMHSILSKVPLVFGMIGAFLTAFYMTRQIKYVFWGQPRGHGADHAHESPSSMTIPLIVLAVMSVVTGFAGLPDTLFGHTHLNKIHHFLAATLESHPVSWGIMGVSSLIVVIAIFSGSAIYSGKALEVGEIDPLERKFPALFQLLHNKWYIDEIYEKFIICPTRCIANGTKLFDRYVLNGFVVWGSRMVIIGLSWVNQLIDEKGINSGFDSGCSTVRKGARVNRWIQSGLSQHYLKLTSAGIAILFIIAFYLGKY